MDADSNRFRLNSRRAGELRRLVRVDRWWRRRRLGALTARESQLFQQLRRDFRGVFALGVAAASQELSAAAAADDHGFATLVTIDVGRDVVQVRLPVAGGGGIGA